MPPAPALPLALPLALLLSAPAPVLRADIRPERLRCEHLTDPLGVDTPRPRLSWIVRSDDRDQRQGAYRILVASRRESLDEERGDLWDSGRVASGRTLHVEYAGRPLPPGARAFWKVRVWDGAGEPSPWSRTALWRQGLPASGDWGVDWIAHPDPVPATVPARNGYHSQLSDRADVTRWIAIDLGEARTIDAVRLHPARPFDWKPDTPGFLFPLRYRVEVDDTAGFTAPRTVVDATDRDAPGPGTTPVVHRFPPRTARHLRLVVTRQRERDARHFGCALAELEVLSGSGPGAEGPSAEGPSARNVAAGARVTALDSIESANWSTAFLVDGDTVSHAGDRPEAQPATLLRTEFDLPARVRSATLWATALGVYEIRLGGQRVGDRVLAPEWTDYHTRIQYQAYDVTSLLSTGRNALAATLGEGWYAGRLGMSDGIQGILRRVYGTRPALRARLDIELVSGERVTVGTRTGWRATRGGPIRKSDLLDGEVHDARREPVGWDRPGFDDHGWRPVETIEAVETARARLVAQPNEPIRVTRELAAVARNEPRPGVFVFDLGENMVGVGRLTLEGPAGTVVTVRHAEMLQPDGSIYTENLRGAPQVDRYTMRGGGPETWQPSFTQHGFRYVELEGLTKAPRLDAVRGLVFHSAAPEVGSFECSDGMLSRLWRNILRTQRGNLMSVPTDCPQRDERLGWMGDIQAFSQTAMFQMDMAAFFTKWLRDVRDAQAEDGRYPDFAPQPYDPETRFSGVPAWGDAGVVVPWRVWVNYGDRRLLEEHFDSTKRWIEFVWRENPDLIWRRGRHNDYGDWLNGDTIRREGWPRRGARVPQEVFATAFFAHSTDLVARMATVLDRTDDARRHRKLFGEIRAAFRREFVDDEGRIQGDTQAGYALALRFGLLPDAMRPAAVRHLIEGIERYGGRLSTGIQTTHRMLLALSDAGRDDVAWRLVTSREFPSWGYMIENGATTIWERWDGYVEGRGFQDPGMNSFNHWALGSVGEWMVRHVLGIQPIEEHPAWARFRIRPRPGGGVWWARGRHDSIRGPIAVDWRREGGVFRLTVEVPANTRAEVHVIAPDEGTVTESGRPAEEAEGVRRIRRSGSAVVYEVGSGRYRFEAR